MTVTLGHFDIWDIWDLQVFWKMSVLLLAHHGIWWELSRKCSQIPLKAWIHPPTLHKTPLYTSKHPQAPQTPSQVSQETPLLLPSTHQTVCEAFGLSGDVREDSGRNEGVRWCLLSVRNVCKCLGLPLAMSRICQGWHGSVWGYLRVSRGRWRV